VEINESLSLAEFDRLDNPTSDDVARLDFASRREYYARRERESYERRVDGRPYWEARGSEPVDPTAAYDFLAREGWEGAPDLRGPHHLSLPADVLRSLHGARFGRPTREDVERAVPEAVEYRVTVGTLSSTAGQTFMHLVVALALAPFLVAISTSLGNKAAEGLTSGYRRVVNRLLKRRAEAARQVLPTRGSTSVRFEMRVEGTRIRIELPLQNDADEMATCIYQLSHMDFEVFGDCRAILYWRDGTWNAAAAAPDREPISLIWQAQGREWQPLHSGVELPLPRRRADGENDDAADGARPT
jgi:hypothetical protein